MSKSRRKGERQLSGGEGAFQAHSWPFGAKRTPRAKALEKECACCFSLQGTIGGQVAGAPIIERAAFILSEMDHCQVLDRSDRHFKRNILTALLGRKGMRVEGRDTVRRISQ